MHPDPAFPPTVPHLAVLLGGGLAAVIVIVRLVVAAAKGKWLEVGAEVLAVAALVALIFFPQQVISLITHLPFITATA